MKRFLFIPILFALFIPKILFSQNSEKIAGTWQMISTKFVYPDSRTMEKTDFEHPAIRIYTKKYYSFGYQNSNGQLAAALGGKYFIEGNKLTQERNYHIAPSYVGKSSEFKFEIKNDQLFLKGTMPNNIKIEEVYKRIE